MRWIELEHPRRDRVTPEFRLTSIGGETVVRSQHRQKHLLVLIFVPDPRDPAAQRALHELDVQRSSLTQAGAVAYAISASSGSGTPPVPVLADPGDRVRDDYAALFPPEDRPGAGEPFVVIADRFGAPQYGGRGPLDPALAEEVDARIWAIAYDCPE